MSDFNYYSSLWIQYFGFAVLQNTLFLGLVFLAFYLLKNADARIKYIIGVLGMVKLLLPPFIPGSFAWFTGIGRGGAGSVTIGEIIPVSAEPPPITEQLSAGSIIFILWLTTLLAYLLISVLSTMILKRRLKSSIRINNPGDSRIKLYFCDKIPSPLSIGLFPKKIFLPAYWDQLPREGQKVLLEHELAHIHRKDGFILLLQTIAQALYFFHPFVWLLNERINVYREMACDDYAIRDAKLTPSAYSRHLMSIAEKIVDPQWSYVSVSALIKQKNKLLNRVSYQLQEGGMKTLSKPKITAVLVCLAALIVPLSWYCSTDKTSAPEEIITQGDNAPAAENVGKIWGTITDAKTGEPIPAVNIFLKGTSMGAATDRDGNYYLVQVPPGIYDLEAQMVGFKNVIFNNVMVEVMKSKKVDIKLSPVVMGLQDDNQEKFTAYDEAPKPVDGFAAVQKNLVYPEIARKAGIEGRVVVNIHIDENGNVTETEIMQSLGDNGCDESAINALKSVKWEPAKQDGKPVSVWIGIPVVFKLK
ncbi:TonB family protein [candidate division KSB1 bacterium]|nr:TonB family protein [candidate division KSB1 bacterium]